MEDSTLFFSNPAASANFGFTPSELEQSGTLSAFPFFTSPPTLSPFQTLERTNNKTTTPFLASSGSKILAESFDAALQALSRQSQATHVFSTADSMHKRPGLPIDFKKPASSIGSSAPSSATSDASDVLADRLDSDFDPDLSADSISLGSNQGRFESWSISPSPVLSNNVQLPAETMPASTANAAAAGHATGTLRSDASQMAADIFAQFIADEHNAETTDTIRGLPMMTPQRPSLFRDFSALTSASSASTMSMGSSPATPLDGQPMQRPTYGLFMDLGSPRKALPVVSRPTMMERSHSQLEAGAFAHMNFGVPPPAHIAASAANSVALFTSVPPHSSSPMPSSAFMSYTVEPAMLSCNPAHIAPSDLMGQQQAAEDEMMQQVHEQQQAMQQNLPSFAGLLRLDGELMNRSRSGSPLKRPADSRKAVEGAKPAKRVKSEPVEPQIAEFAPASPSQILSSPTTAQDPAMSRPSMGGAGMDDASEERPSPVRAIPGFVAQTFHAPSTYMAAEMQPDWAATAAAQKCADSTNIRIAAGSATAGSSSSAPMAVLGPAAVAAAATSASGSVQPTPIPVKALIGQHSAATLAHGRPVITATVPLPTYSGIITKRSRGRRVPNDPLEMQNLGKGGKIWTCLVPECGKCFRRSEHLKRHIRSIHTEERPYMCPFPGCHKGFSRHDNLNQHARVHQMTEAEGGAGESSAMMPSLSSSSSLVSSGSASSRGASSRKRKAPDGCEEEEALASRDGSGNDDEDGLDELDEE